MNSFEVSVDLGMLGDWTAEVIPLASHQTHEDLICGILNGHCRVLVCFDGKADTDVSEHVSDLYWETIARDVQHQLNAEQEEWPEHA